MQHILSSQLSSQFKAKWHIYASANETIFGSGNGLSPGRHQAIIWTSARILLIGPSGTNFNEILI